MLFTEKLQASTDCLFILFSFLLRNFLFRKQADYWAYWQKWVDCNFFLINVMDIASCSGWIFWLIIENKFPYYVIFYFAQIVEALLLLITVLQEVFGFSITASGFHQLLHSSGNLTFVSSSPLPFFLHSDFWIQVGKMMLSFGINCLLISLVEIDNNLYFLHFAGKSGLLGHQ